jgi:hypothetical protein
MPAWVRCSRGALIYSGRIARQPFMVWAATPPGRAAVDAVASRIRFSLFSKTQSARRRIWRQLAEVARDQSVVAAIQGEVQAYLQRLGELAYADGLPRATVSLRRLVVVPRVLLNAAAYRSIERRLNGEPAFESLEGGESLRVFFFQRLIEEVEAAVANAQPSPTRPLAAGTDWITVGVDAAFVWRLPMFEGPSWNGHHYVLELTREPITRPVRRAVTASIDGLGASLPSLSREERNQILRRASTVA